ncbi:MAG: T9SS type A sorting domain-containing protein, partial [bacterium]
LPAFRTTLTSTVSSTGTVLDTLVVFQFDKDSTYDAATNACGTLVLLLKGITSANSSRYFDIYFDATGGTFARPSFPGTISITDTASYQGQATYIITTPLAKYFYHKLGGGFASMMDTTGRDWISYHPGGGSSGEYHGIPNLGPVAHPGYVNATSRLISQGPLKATILSQTVDSAWLWQWDFFPEYARLTLHRRGDTYWILYEGTPGGVLNVPGDFWVRSPGIRLDVSEQWVGELPAPEWVYFGDVAMRRVLYLSKHEDDNAGDQYWQLENNMTVFGFGRQFQCCDRYLTAVPMHLTIGFAEDSVAALATLSGSSRDLNVSLGSPSTTGVRAYDNILPVKFALEQNYPNPFNPTTKIRFAIPSRGEESVVTLKVFDVLGREMKTLVDEPLGAGTYEVTFDAAELATGVYFYRLQAGKYNAARKLLVTR